MHARQLISVAALLLLTVTGQANADTIIVQQDGSGDTTTIGAAAAMAAAGDSILVGPGTYAEGLLYIDKPLHLASILGPDQTVLDGLGADQILKFEHAGSSDLAGFRFVNGFIANGAGLFVSIATVSIRDCVFEDNVATYQGGAIACGNAGAILVTDCLFRDNYAPQHAGAAVVIQSSKAQFSSCLFFENRTDVSAGALAAHSSVMNVSGCLFCRNRSDDIAGAIYLYASSSLITGNTFYENTSPGHATVVINESAGTVVERNILARETNGFGLRYIACTGVHGCNIYWDNADGPIDPPGLAADEIVADPLFCEPWQDNFMIYDISPAAPEHSPCGLLVGAFPVGCTGTAARETTWGNIKAIY
ncbi:MAG: right-handed parallel beta-helix repeat-containing protein [Candidatus Krumholzibacteriota bacterium]|nr:right-handed parallel beta-helix repeat-containing protein [Candidatus Krumholzibacteriota bacterium]